MLQSKAPSVTTQEQIYFNSILDLIQGYLPFEKNKGQNLRKPMFAFLLNNIQTLQLRKESLASLPSFVGVSDLFFLPYIQKQMKQFVYLALIGSISAVNLTTESADWKEYRASRGEHDCAISENQNWLGLQKCAYGWECKGARLCTRGKAENDGFCTGDSFCPELGPLDFHDANGEVVWNEGGHQLTDGYDQALHQRKVEKAEVIKGYFDDADQNEFQVDEQLKKTEEQALADKKKEDEEEAEAKGKPEKKSTILKDVSTDKNPDGTPLADNQKPNPRAAVDDTTNSTFELKTVDIGKPPKEDQPDQKNSDDSKSEEKEQTKTKPSTNSDQKPDDAAEMMLAEIHSGSPWALDENTSRF